MAHARRFGSNAPFALVLAGSISAALAAPDLRPQAPAPDFMKRMMREARREIGRSAEPVPLPGAVDDLEKTEARSRQAERILRRSLKGALGDRLEPLLRSLPALDTILPPRDSSVEKGPLALEPPPGAGAGGPAALPQERAFSGSVGFRLDAHPRLLIRGRLHDTRGVLELPVLDRELRLSIDQPLGGFGTASFRGGVSEERGEWVSLSINLRF